MRSLLVVTLLLASGVPADMLAQTPSVAPAAPATAPARTPDGTQPWDRIQGLMAGTKLHIKFKSGSKAECRVVTVSADALHCDSTATFERENIASIRSNHRVRSTIVGLAAGYIAAAAVVGIAAAGDPPKCNNIGCAVTIAFVALGLVIATPIIAHVTDFTGTTIYKAPDTAAAVPHS